MRKITQEAVSAFINGKNYRSGNTQVNQRIGGMELLLHSNIIAVDTGEGLKITNAGWKSNTTKERLNGLPNVSIQQIKGQWYLNGQKWNGEWIKVN